MLADVGQLMATNGVPTTIPSVALLLFCVNQLVKPITHNDRTLLAIFIINPLTAT